MPVTRHRSPTTHPPLVLCPGEGGVGEIPGESDNLSIEGREDQGGIVGGHSTRSQKGGSRSKQFELSTSKAQGGVIAICAPHKGPRPWGH
jgi:hypothetical protein